MGKDPGFERVIQRPLSEVVTKTGRMVVGGNASDSNRTSSCPGLFGPVPLFLSNPNSLWLSLIEMEGRSVGRYQNPNTETTSLLHNLGRRKEAPNL
jgi:hypothetical protein